MNLYGTKEGLFAEIVVYLSLSSPEAALLFQRVLTHFMIDFRLRVPGSECFDAVQRKASRDS